MPTCFQIESVIWRRKTVSRFGLPLLSEGVLVIRFIPS
jgi:hypothetical protein